MTISSVSFAPDVSAGTGIQDLETLMLALQMQRTENIDSMLQDQANLLKNQQDKLSEANRVMANLRNAQVKTSEKDAVTWSVDKTHIASGRATMMLRDENYDYRIDLNKANSQWTVTRLDKQGNALETSRIWGDPHVDVNNDGTTDWDFKADSTFELMDGIKITVGTVPYSHNPNMTLSDTLTITKGDQHISVKNLSQENRNGLEVSDVLLDGRDADFATADGWTIKERADGEWNTADGQLIDADYASTAYVGPAETYNNEVNLSQADQDFLRAAGIIDDTWDGKVTDDFVKNSIESLKGFMDGQNSTSQLDMIRMQSIMNKRNQAFDMMTNTISKLSKSKDAVIGNIR